MESISERIKTALELREMKQADLIKLTGINKGALSSYISGKYEPKQNNIFLMAKALNVSEAWLMGYDVPMERKPITFEVIPEDTGRDKRLLSYMTQLYDAYQKAPKHIQDAVRTLLNGDGNDESK